MAGKGRRWARLVVASGLVAGSMAAATEVHAEQQRHDDPLGDVVLLDDDPEPVPERAQGDITQVIIDHREHKVVLRVRFAALDAEGSLDLGGLIRTGTGRRFLQVWTYEGSPAGWHWLYDSTGETVRCPRPRHEIDYDRDAISVHLSRRCLNGPESVRMTLSMQTYPPEEEDAGLHTTYIDDAFSSRSGIQAWSPTVCRGEPGGEVVRGTRRPDRLRGTAHRDTIRGRAGADDLRGLGGADLVRGGPGADDLAGGACGDVLRGAGGDDTLRGGAGDDVIASGGGRDSAYGGRGDDTIHHAGGGGLIRCGPGRDTVLGGHDADLRGCEVVLPER